MSYKVSMSPHIHSGESIQRIMMDVIIALIPAAIFSIYHFGPKALLMIVLSILSCVGSEALFQKITGKAIVVGDLSAVVTGLLLALNIPHTAPWFVPVLGGAFAIIIVKQIFGGLGQNFMNPALGARAFLLISFAGAMTRWEVDGVSGATPLMVIKEAVTTLGTEDAIVSGVTKSGVVEALITQGEIPELFRAFIGSIGGSLGETSALALLLGGIYLIARKVISWRIPVSFIGTTAIMVFLFGGFDITTVMYHLFTGGLFIGAFFMATDYSSSPNSKSGQIIMGIGCGLLTALIRLYGSYPEGVSFAILIMNLFVPLIDRYTIPKAFGEVKA